MIGIQALLQFHVGISFVGILTGLIVLYGMLRNERMTGWTAAFLAATLITTLTGFLFPISVFTPALGVGIVSTLVMAVCLVARYGYRLAGRWRAVYVFTAILALWLNVFVLIVQAFLKVDAFNALAPNGNEPPFLIAQAVVLGLFVIGGFLALRRFHPVPGATLTPA